MDIKKLGLEILRELYGGSRRLSMYPLGHPITQETLKKPLALLNQIYSFKHSFNIEFFKDRLLAEGILLDDTVYVAGLALDMKKHKLSSISLYSQIKTDDLYHFLSILISKPMPFDDGVAQSLNSKNIESIAVNRKNLRNLFHFESGELSAGQPTKTLEKRVRGILLKNPSIISTYYMGRIKDDDDILKYINVDFRLVFLSKFFRESLLSLPDENAKKLLENTVFSTNWLDDSIDTRAIEGLKRLFNDYLSNQDDNRALNDIYALFKKVGAPEVILNQLFDRSKVLKLKTFQDSEEIINTLKFSDPSLIDTEYLKKTVFKLTSAGQREYLFDILDQLMNSLSGSTKAIRQQALHLLTTASEVISGGGFFEEYASLCRSVVRLALFPAETLEASELTCNLAWQALKKKRWQELKFLARMLKGITSDYLQPESKREFVAARLLEISEANLLSELTTDFLENNLSEEPGDFLEAISNLGSKKVIQMLVERITDPDINIRSRIIKILIRMKADSAETISQLLSEEVESYNGDKIEEEKWYYLRNILRVLREVSAEEALPSLEIMSAWPDNRLKLEIVKTLEGMPVEGSAKLLEKLSFDEDYEVRKGAVIAMGLSGHPDMIPKLEAIIGRSSDCQILAIASLGRIGGPKARNILIDLFENDEFYQIQGLSKKDIEEIRVAIIKALSRIGDQISLRKLEEFSKKNFDKSLFKKDMLSNTAKIVLGIKDK
ncbi:MAG: HEAT repeat domain-containing protein [Candidatus Zixiibacteriota bacterium]|nr:MAG: HEAT repeat domain-containing protein [candidate division Zixibacteria bacterium]